MKKERNALRPIKSSSNSPFGSILARVVESSPGCHAAAFVDREGEAVDVAGVGEDFDIKVAAAHWQIVLQQIHGLPLGTVEKLLIGTAQRSYCIVPLAEGYSLVLQCKTRRAFHVSERAISVCCRALENEAGFEQVVAMVEWRAIEVLPSGSRLQRPERVQFGGKWEPVEVLGLLMGLPQRERGYRVRLQNGVEMTLVRESLGRWWTDETVECAELPVFFVFF